VLQEETLGLGERFTPIGNSFFLDLISLPLSLFGGQGAPEITLKIMADASGQPGQALGNIPDQRDWRSTPGIRGPFCSASSSRGKPAVLGDWFR
jgi:hypothetical protein